MAVYPRGKKFMASFGAGAGRVRKTFNTEAEGVAWETQQEAAREAVNALPVAPVVPTCWTLQQALNHVHRETWKGTGGESNAMRNANQAIAFFGADTPVTAIISTWILEWMEELADVHENTGPTRNKKMSSLRMMLMAAHVNEGGGLLTMPRMKRFKETLGRIHWYDEETEATMLKLCDQMGLPELKDFIIVGLDTGFRRTEMMSLRTADYRNNALILHAGATKSGLGRSVPCTARVKAIIQARIDAGQTKVFPGLTVNGLRAQWESLRAVMGKSEDPNFIIHVMRHTCATRLVSKGVPINVVQAWMGHAVIATTMRYAHVLPNALMAAVGVLEPATV